MRVAVVNLTSGNFSGGYKKYLRQLMPLLGEHPEVSALHVYSPREYAAESADTQSVVWPQMSGRKVREWIARNVREFSADVILVPTARLVHVSGVPTVVMVRNMEPFVSGAEDGNPVMDRVRNMARRYVTKHACMNASRVIAVSNFVKDVIVERWDLPEARIGVVPHGVVIPSADFAVAPSHVRDWVGDCKFLFTAGSIRPARGLDDIVQAWPRIREQISGLKLVIAGLPDRGGVAHQAELRQRISMSGAAAEVLWAGELTEQQMAWCYQKAAAFIMTSRAEACPNIVLEAMAHGALCVSTNAPPMPEFFGDVATYYNARSADSLAHEVVSALGQGVRVASRRREATRKRGNLFTWDRTAALTVAELAKAIAVSHQE